MTIGFRTPPGARRPVAVAAHRRGVSARGIVLAVAAFAAIVTAVNANKMVVHTAWPLAAVLLALDYRDGRALPAFPWSLAAVLASVLALGAASVLWSIEPDLTLSRLGKVAAIAAGAVLLMAASRRLAPGDYEALGVGVVSGIVAALALAWAGLATGGAFTDLFYDAKSGGSGAIISQLNEGLSAVAIFAWSGTLYLVHVKRYDLALGLGGAALATFWWSEGGAVSLGATAGLAVAALALKAPGRLATWVGVLAVAWILAAPVAVKGTLSAFEPDLYSSAMPSLSTAHRLHIWRFTADRIVERPLLGYGLGTARRVPGAREKMAIPYGKRTVERTALPIHPHNGPLEWWLDLGLPGALLGALGVFLLVRPMSRLGPPWARALVLGQFVTAFVIYNFAFGAWQGWWLVTFVLAAYFTLILLEGVEAESEGPAPGVARVGRPPFPPGRGSC